MEDVFRFADQLGPGKIVRIHEPRAGLKAIVVVDNTVRAFAAAIRNLGEYIPRPDMGTNKTAMAWVKDEIGRAVGLPRELGGIPPDEIGATGFGLAVAVAVRRALPLSLTFDHRVVTGGEAACFLVALKRDLERLT